MRKLIWCLERLLWVGRLGADVEIAANSVERVKEYMHLPQEEFAGANPPDNWPSGKEGIKVKDLEAFYGPGQDAVLKKVSFDIAPGVSFVWSCHLGQN